MGIVLPPFESLYLLSFHFRMSGYTQVLNVALFDIFRLRLGFVCIKSLLASCPPVILQPFSRRA